MWADIGIAVLLLAGIYCFLYLLGFQSRLLTRKSNRRAEDLYSQYADSRRQQRRYARERGGEWRNERSAWGGSGLHSPGDRH